MRTAPVLIAELARVIATEERQQQGAGAFVLRVIRDPHRAKIHRQLAPAALQVVAPHHRRDAIRLQEALHDMRLGGVLGDMDPLHRDEDSIC